MTQEEFCIAVEEQQHLTNPERYEEVKDQITELLATGEYTKPQIAIMLGCNLRDVFRCWYTPEEFSKLSNMLSGRRCCGQLVTNGATIASPLTNDEICRKSMEEYLDGRRSREIADSFKICTSTLYNRFKRYALSHPEDNVSIRYKKKKFKMFARIEQGQYCN